jgi:hypothetical protein
MLPLSVCVDQLAAAAAAAVLRTLSAQCKDAPWSAQVLQRFVLLKQDTIGGGIVTRRHVRSQQEWHCLPG